VLWCRCDVEMGGVSWRGYGVLGVSGKYWQSVTARNPGPGVWKGRNSWFCGY